MHDPSSRHHRKPRADARRNRQRLLETAQECFAKTGTATTLDEIARSAGVGIGTLYRHFPTRDALVEAVYRNAIEQLAEAADSLSETHTPVEAMRQWLLLFVDHLATKKIMADALASLVCGVSELYAVSGVTLRSTIETLAARAVASQAIELKVEPFDLLRAIAGVANLTPGPEWEAGARAMVDILITGMKRHQGTAP